MKNAFHRWTKRLFHRSDKKRSYHSTPDQGRISSFAHQNHEAKNVTKRNLIQPSSKRRNLPQDTSALGTSTNADEQHTAPISLLVKVPNQPSTTLDAQTSSAKEYQAPSFDGRKTSASPQPPRNMTQDSQVANATVSKNQPQFLKRQPHGTQEGYYKPASNREETNEALLQGSSYTPPSESSHRNPSLGKSYNREKEAKAQSRDKHTNGPTTVGSDTTKNDEIGHYEVYTDRTIHPRPAVIHQEIKPHIHTIYEPRRTRSFHLHEHRMVIQPIIDHASTVTSN